MMPVYVDKAKKRIKSKVNKIRSLCNSGKNTNMLEADTRAIVQSVLTDLLGWEMILDVTQETEINRDYCDYMIHLKGKPYMVIEVKPVSKSLKENHLKQARHYAQDKGIDWVILTNGDEWQVYRLYYKKHAGANPEPELFFLYSTSFTDTEGIKSKQRVEDLYLLSKEASKHNELEAFYQQLSALSPQELTKRILQKDVLDRIRIGIKNDINYRIDNEELAQRIISIISDEAIPTNPKYWINKSK